MRTSIISFVLISFIFLISPILVLADNDNSQKPIRFELTIKPNQQYARIKLDGDDHRQIQLKAEYIKLNPTTNNHHIKITITNNSGQVLYHQLVLIDKVEHSEIKYPDSTTDSALRTGERPFTPTQLPYYNYGNIKSAQTTPREWYLSNTGNEEIEVQGYIISKEIPIAIDPKIMQLEPNLALTLTTYLSALRDNDLGAVVATLAQPDINFAQDLPKEYTDAYNKYPGRFPEVAIIRAKPNTIELMSGRFCYITYTWLNPKDGVIHSDYLELQYDDYRHKWWITF